MSAELHGRLIALYARLAAHTEPECTGRCERPRSCCAEMYCAFAIEHAKTRWQVELQRTWHPELPLMGDDGCTAAPHLRPICTAHTCEMCAHGHKRGDPAWTRRYDDIMGAIAEIEAAVSEKEAAL
jgi:hypothetical protein